MNFLSHYYCRKLDDPYYTLGLMLPDIFPKFSYFHNKFFTKYDTSSLSKCELMLWNGIEQHYSDDGYFHTMSSFRSSMKEIEEEMANMPYLNTIKRRYLISHVLYEIILDHIIIQRFTNIVSEIYKDIDQVDMHVVENFLKKILGNETQIEVFLKSLNKFLERRFLNFYSEERNIVKALHRVTGIIGVWEYKEESEKEFVHIIQKMKSSIDFGKTFDMIKQHKQD